MQFQQEAHSKVRQRRLQKMYGYPRKRRQRGYKYPFRFPYTNTIMPNPRWSGRTFRRRRTSIQAIGIEKKFFDTSLVNSVLSTTASQVGGEHNPSGTIGVTTMAQGDGNQQREGRKATWDSLFINGVIRVDNQVNQTIALDATTVFISVVLDTQTNSAFLSSEDVYVNPSASAVMCARPLRNLNFGKRFRILATKTIDIQTPRSTFDGANIETGGWQETFKIYIDLKRIVATYLSTAADIANSRDYAISILAWTDNTQQVPTISYNSRLRFFG